MSFMERIQQAAALRAGAKKAWAELGEEVLLLVGPDHEDAPAALGAMIDALGQAQSEPQIAALHAQIEQLEREVEVARVRVEDLRAELERVSGQPILLAPTAAEE